MKALKVSLSVSISLLVLLGGGLGCETTDNSGSPGVGSVYYGTGVYDVWYHGDYDDDPDYIVTPPPNRPDLGPRPEHPIAKPPPSLPSAPRPMPAMPSMPRGGGRR